MFKKIDRKTEGAVKCVPFTIMVGLALSALIAASVLQILGKRRVGMFFSPWPATFLSLGLLKIIIEKVSRRGD